MLTTASIPALRRGVRRRHDPVRHADILQAPERVVVLDDIAGAIVELCDARTSIAQIAAVLAARYAADIAQVEPDVLAFVQELADKGLLAA